MRGGLGSPADFPTDLQGPMSDFQLEIERLKVKERVHNLAFRLDRKKLRKLKAPVVRWEHKERLDETEPELGCGFPVCAVVDSRPKRFVSMCKFAAWMKEEGLTRRVIQVQKGGCEDVSE